MITKALIKIETDRFRANALYILYRNRKASRFAQRDG